MLILWLYDCLGYIVNYIMMNVILCKYVYKLYYCHNYLILAIQFPFDLYVPWKLRFEKVQTTLCFQRISHTWL